MIQSAMHTGLAGMQNSYRNMTEAAGQLVGNTGQGPDGPTRGLAADAADSFVHMMNEERIFTASAKVVGTADRSLGTLLDAMA